jgi:hypothetical protein
MFCLSVSAFFRGDLAIVVRRDRELGARVVFSRDERALAWPRRARLVF